MGRLLHSVQVAFGKFWHSPVYLWFCLSLLVALICGVLGLIEGLSSSYIVQDDARSHVFWMQRFQDQELFGGDYIANYFQSVAPPGYTSLYWGFSQLGIPPLLFNKILPLFLGLITTGYGFGVCLEIFPAPFAGFLTALFLNQNLWLKDDLISGTPRAFFYPFFVGFLYYLLRHSPLGVGIMVALLGVFYPQGVLIAVVLVILEELRRLSQSYFSGAGTQGQRRRGQALTLITLIVAFFVLLPYAMEKSEFGAVISLAEAKELPNFWPGGRATFFSNHFGDFWIWGDRSGLLPPEWLKKGILPLEILVILSLICIWKFPHYFPLKKFIKPSFVILPEFLISSVILFFAAHGFLFKLHHPSRYTQHSFRVLMAIVAGITFTIVLDQGWRLLKIKFPQGSQNSYHPANLIFVSLLTLAFCYPSFTNPFPNTRYIQGKTPLLYEFFAIQPKDILIASLAVEANNLPSFSGRSILVGSEYALPYHQNYYQQWYQRSHDLIQAQYSPNLAEVKQFIKKYGIDFWLLEVNSFTQDYVNNNHRIAQLNLPATLAIRENLATGTLPALTKVIDRCSVLNIDTFMVLEAECILEQNESLN